MEVKELPSLEEVNVLSVIQLRKVLGACGLEMSGLKTELQRRLEKYLKNKKNSIAMEEVTNKKSLPATDSALMYAGFVKNKNKLLDGVKVINIPSSSDDSAIEEIPNIDIKHGRHPALVEEKWKKRKLCETAVKTEVNDCRDIDFEKANEPLNKVLENSVPKKKSKKKRKKSKKKGKSMPETLLDYGTKENGGRGNGKKSAHVLQEIKVFNLATSVKAVDLKEHFAKHGKVCGARIFVNKSSKNRNFGLVRMSTVEETMLCVKKLDRSQLQGRAILLHQRLSKSSKKSPESVDLAGDIIDLRTKVRMKAKHALDGSGILKSDTKDIDSAIELLEKELRRRKEKQLSDKALHEQRNKGHENKTSSKGVITNITQITRMEKENFENSKLNKEGKNQKNKKDTKFWSNIEESSSGQYTSPLAVYSKGEMHLDNYIDSDNDDFHDNVQRSERSANIRYSLSDDEDNNSQSSKDSWLSIEESLLKNNRSTDGGRLSQSGLWEVDEEFPLMKDNMCGEVDKESLKYKDSRKSVSPLDRDESHREWSDSTETCRSESPRKYKPLSLHEMLNHAGLKTTDDLSLTNDSITGFTHRQLEDEDKNDSPIDQFLTDSTTESLNRESLGKIQPGTSKSVLSGFTDAMLNSELCYQLGVAPGRRNHNESALDRKVGVLPLDPAAALCAGYNDALRDLGMVQ